MDEFILIHQRYHWLFNLSQWALTLPGYPTRFMGKLYWVPKYVFDENLRQEALADLIEQLIKKAPFEVPAHVREDLWGLQRQLKYKSLRGEMLVNAETKLMMQFGFEKLPGTIAMPPEMAAKYPEPQKSFWNWQVFIKGFCYLVFGYYLEHQFHMIDWIKRLLGGL